MGLIVVINLQYINIESLCCTPETNMMVCQLYLNKKIPVFKKNTQVFYDSSIMKLVTG